MKEELTKIGFCLLVYGFILYAMARNGLLW